VACSSAVVLLSLLLLSPRSHPYRPLSAQTVLQPSALQLPPSWQPAVALTRTYTYFPPLSMGVPSVMAGCMPVTGWPIDREPRLSTRSLYQKGLAARQRSSAEGEGLVTGRSCTASAADWLSQWVLITELDTCAGGSAFLAVQTCWSHDRGPGQASIVTQSGIGSLMASTEAADGDAV
jgi:hypothetical protein